VLILSAVMMPKSSGWSTGGQHEGNLLFKTDHILLCLDPHAAVRIIRL
jgi:hypothetical protein